MSTDPTNDPGTAMKALRKSQAPAPSPQPPSDTVRAKPSSKSLNKPKVAVRTRAKATGRSTGKPALPIVVPEILEDPRGSKCGIEDSKPGFDLKAQLTVKELKFIELYVTGEHTVETAMESAGYIGYHPNSLYRIGRKIVQKYESQAGDHRKVMRAMGYGEVKAIEMLIDSAKNAKSEMVKLNARVALAKCLGLYQDVVQSHVGVNIIITGRSPRPPEPVEGGGRPAQVHVVQAAKPLQITK